jgi:hypothetical protein
MTAQSSNNLLRRASGAVINGTYKRLNLKVLHALRK